jgi:hypothetical protein
VPRSVAENPTIDRRARIAPPANTTSGPLKTGTFAYRESLFPRGRRVVDYPIPDFSKIKPKVNTNLRNLKKDEEGKTVSCAVTCSVVQMEERNSPVTG